MMITKQTIAVIGATGNMGSAISRSLATGNYRLLLYTNKKQQAQSLTEEIKTAQPSADIEEMDCEVQATWEADIIILAVPFEAEKEVAEQIREMANQKIVISISNPLNSNCDDLVTQQDAEELQKLLPHSKVFKACNTTFATDFSTPVIDGRQADVFIAGNDEEALPTVTELVAIAGFNPIVAGDLPVTAH